MFARIAGTGDRRRPRRWCGPPARQGGASPRRGLQRPPRRQRSAGRTARRGTAGASGGARGTSCVSRAPSGCRARCPTCWAYPSACSTPMAMGIPRTSCCSPRPTFRSSTTSSCPPATRNSARARRRCHFARGVTAVHRGRAAASRLSASVGSDELERVRAAALTGPTFRPRGGARDGSLRRGRRTDDRRAAGRRISGDGGCTLHSVGLSDVVASELPWRALEAADREHSRSGRYRPRPICRRAHHRQAHAAPFVPAGPAVTALRSTPNVRPATQAGGSTREARAGGDCGRHGERERDRQQQPVTVTREPPRVRREEYGNGPRNPTRPRERPRGRRKPRPRQLSGRRPRTGHDLPRRAARFGRAGHWILR